ncbi:MAG: metal ABC transporter solute-binding protein, Zn/Mn family, partial [Acidimicrobiales bacterium]
AVGRAAAVGLVAAAGLAGCAAATAPPPARRLGVVATNFALAQLVAAVGTDRVSVTDLAAGAADDRTVTLTAAQLAAARGAAAVVEVGGGYQPRLEEAMASGEGPPPARVLALGSRLGATPSPEFWLDPRSMARAAGLVAAALEAADPAGRATYQAGAADERAVLGTLGIDYQSTLAGCIHNVAVVPDGAFAGTARYGVSLDVVGPGATAAEVAAAAAAARAGGVSAAFSEPPASAASVDEVGRQAHLRVLALDTLDGPPLAVEPSGYGYFNRMEGDLARLASGLDCPSSSGP